MNSEDSQEKYSGSVISGDVDGLLKSINYLSNDNAPQDDLVKIDDNIFYPEWKTLDTELTEAGNTIWKLVSNLCSSFSIGLIYTRNRHGPSLDFQYNTVNVLNGESNKI